MKTKDEIIQFIFSEYDYYCTYIKYLQDRISNLRDINDIKYLVFTKTIVDLTLKADALKKIIDFIDSKEVKEDEIN